MTALELLEQLTILIEQRPDIASKEISVRVEGEHWLGWSVDIDSLDVIVIDTY